MSEVWQRLKKWLLGWINWQPHFVVGPKENPYLLRWYIVPRNDWFNIYVHKFLRDDDDRAMHDHPWWSLSVLLHGSYVEQTTTGRITYGFGAVIIRQAEYTHRIELPKGKPCWTLFITGKRVREWGFYCPRGWVHWKDFTAVRNTGEIGKGCD